MRKRKLAVRIIACLCAVLIAFTTIIAYVSAEEVSETNDTVISDAARSACEEIGEAYNIAPELLMAIIERESAGQPYVSNGNCVGLMQVNKSIHKDRAARLGVSDFYDEYSNILVGTDLLAELVTESKDISYALDLYNGNRNARYNYENGIISSYASSILKRAEELERLHYGSEEVESSHG